MKKKILSMIGLALFVGAVAFNMHFDSGKTSTSDITLKNIEALAGTDAELVNCLYGGPDRCGLWPDVEDVWWEVWQ
jgi:hypothetical protein